MVLNIKWNGNKKQNNKDLEMDPISLIVDHPDGNITSVTWMHEYDKLLYIMHIYRYRYIQYIISCTIYSNKNHVKCTYGIMLLSLLSVTMTLKGLKAEDSFVWTKVLSFYFIFILFIYFIFILQNVMSFW